MPNSILGKQPISAGNSPLGVAYNPQLAQQFRAFQQQFSGDPKQQVMQMLQSGQINQQQLNQVMQQARQLQKFL